VRSDSTRPLDDLEQAMAMTGISKSQMSRLCDEIDDKAKRSSAARSRAAGRMRGSTTYVKERQQERTVSVAVGINSVGRREVLGIDIGPSEAETFWTAFFAQARPPWPARRQARRLRRVRGHKATAATALNASWQRCRVHCATRWRTWQERAAWRLRPRRHRVCPRRCSGRQRPMAPGRRSAPPETAQARYLPGRG
jgi:transposase-like protein